MKSNELISTNPASTTDWTKSKDVQFFWPIILIKFLLKKRRQETKMDFSWQREPSILLDLEYYEAPWPNCDTNYCKRRSPGGKNLKLLVWWAQEVSCKILSRLPRCTKLRWSADCWEEGTCCSPPQTVQTSKELSSCAGRLWPIRCWRSFRICWVSRSPWPPEATLNSGASYPKYLSAWETVEAV